MAAIQRLKSWFNCKEGSATEDAQPIVQDTNNGTDSNRRKGTSRLHLLRLSAAVCGIEFCYSAETAFVSPILLKAGVPESYMSLIWCLSPTLGFFLTPILGSASDRCSSKIGRRRPFILLLSAGIMIGLILVPNGHQFGDLCDVDEMDNVSATISFDEELYLYGSNENSTFSITSFDVTVNATASPDTHVVRQVCTIAVTVLGVVLLDFCADAAQSPTRAYLIDVIPKEDHQKGLSSFTTMAGLGGFVGYLICGIPWEKTTFASVFFDQIHIAFFLVLVVFIVAVALTVTSDKELTLDEIRSKPRQITSQSGTHMELTTLDTKKTYGTQDQEPVTQRSNDYSALNGTSTEHKDEESDFQHEQGSMKDYLLSIIYMPYSLRILCLTNLFCWMSLLCYSLYFTDFVGRAVYGGEPTAPKGSEELYLYEEGVRNGSFAMAVDALSCSIFSFYLVKLVKRFGAKPVYICNQLFYTFGMIWMAVLRTKWITFLASITTGAMYSTLFTMPFIILADYHSNNMFEKSKESGVTRHHIRGIGTDVAVVQSMVFVGQFTLSLCMGSLIHYFGTVVSIVSAAILSFCGAICASQVVYLGL
ncbi:membrane-associated transporter protein-like [Anneissia japonica]|uniref:membrane-associated transporter protein-like n=1 Tax=Anneissia japonica TaxID=1529436 RepID=UPI0014257070|nr:membrane-associated transporter protein-like [Anneissia japonica]XP_033126748.1 membrane-associated transporter protein-like [Anneissia japonica]XP_033126749.1 membrane-associated transporter protein-like [Anneissia japonica]